MPRIPVSTKCRQQTADRIQNIDCRLQSGYKMQTENLKSFYVWYIITCHLTAYRAKTLALLTKTLPYLAYKAYKAYKAFMAFKRSRLNPFQNYRSITSFSVVGREQYDLCMRL